MHEASVTDVEHPWPVREDAAIRHHPDTQAADRQPRALTDRRNGVPEDRLTA
ncbi:hypothetical protein [Streptomyces sp. NPDC054854]